MRTWLQSQSSSSATIIGRDVLTPWPISGFFATMVTVPSGAMETNAESTAAAELLSSIASSADAGSGISASSARPPPARREALRTARRSSMAGASGDMTALLFHAGSNADGAADPVVTGAAADVAGHGRVDLRIARASRLAEQ